MNHRKAILVVMLAGTVVGGCDMSGMSQPMGMVPRSEYDRALADAKSQRAEVARQQGEAQKWQRQAQQDRQLVEQVRGETSKILDTVREEGQARSAKMPSLEQANEDLVTRIQGLGKRVRDLEADLSRAAQENKSVQEENRQLRAQKAPVIAPTVAARPAEGAEKPAVVEVKAPPVVAPAPPLLSGEEQERQRLLAQAAKELSEAKAVLGSTSPVGPGEGMSSSPASRPAEVAPAAPGLGGTVTEVRGAKVKISLGARNGLRRDTRMYVHRGSEFIGVLQLSAIEDQTAEGIVDGRLSANVGDQAVVFGD